MLNSSQTRSKYWDERRESSKSPPRSHRELSTRADPGPSEHFEKEVEDQLKQIREKGNQVPVEYMVESYTSQGMSSTVFLDRECNNLL